MSFLRLIKSRLELFFSMYCIRELVHVSFRLGFKTWGFSFCFFYSLKYLWDFVCFYFGFCLFVCFFWSACLLNNRALQWRYSELSEQAACVLCAAQIDTATQPHPQLNRREDIHQVDKTGLLQQISNFILFLIHLYKVYSNCYQRLAYLYHSIRQFRLLIFCML